MKRTITLIAAVIVAAMACSGASAKEKDNTVYSFTDARTLPVLGKISEKTAGPFTRLPEKLKKATREPVWTLGLCSAGISIRFSSDAGKFRFRWKTRHASVQHSNMSAVCERGLALYVYDSGKWVFVNSTRPSLENAESEYTISCSKLGGKLHEYMLYLGLYDETLSVEIGVPEGSRISAPAPDSPQRGKAIVMYGTSILQGASASHPGMCGANQLSRKLDREVINLGFAGNAKLDYEIAELMASYPTPAVYVLDNLPNCKASLIHEKTEHFVKILRDAHPGVPIVLVENPQYPGKRYDKGRAKEVDSRNKALSKVFNQMKKDGMNDIYYVSGRQMLTRDNIGTCEGTHFTDIGFTNYAKALYPTLKKLCK